MANRSLECAIERKTWVGLKIKSEKRDTKSGGLHEMMVNLKSPHKIRNCWKFWEKINSTL